VLEHVASGRRIAIMRNPRRVVSPSGRRLRPVIDIAPAEICIAWLSTRRSPIISDLWLSLLALIGRELSAGGAG